MSADDVAVQVDGNDDVGAQGAADGNRDRVDQAAVNEPAVIVFDGGKQAGDGNGGPHRIEDRSAGKPDFPSGLQVGGYGGKPLVQVLDAQVVAGDIPVEKQAQPLRIDKPVQGGIDFKKPDGLEPVQGADPRLQLRQVAGGMGRADQGPD